MPGRSQQVSLLVGSNGLIDSAKAQDREPVDVTRVADLQPDQERNVVTNSAGTIVGPAFDHSPAAEPEEATDGGDPVCIHQYRDPKTGITVRAGSDGVPVDLQIPVSALTLVSPVLATRVVQAINAAVSLARQDAAHAEQDQ